MTRNKLDWMIRKGEITFTRILENAASRSEPKPEDGPRTPSISLPPCAWEQDPAELIDLRAEATPRSIPIRSAPLAVEQHRPANIGAAIAAIRAAHRAHVEGRA